MIATGLGLIGTAASVGGNELAIRFGRRRLVQSAMAASVALGAVTGFVGSWSYGLAAALLTIYGVVIWLDSASLTAGSAGTADPARRGATLAVHSSFGYAGGFIGPLLIGWTLDLSGGMSRTGWGIAFLVVAALMALALAAFWLLRPRELAGDRGAEPER
jgi:MFS family permease